MMLSVLPLVNLNSTFAQNMTHDNMTSTVNMTTNILGRNMTGGNITTSDAGAGSAKFHLEEGIKALQAGDIELARTHLQAGEQTLSNASPEVIRHFEEGIRALDGGDHDGAIMHIDIAIKLLG